MTMNRIDGRKTDELRPMNITSNFLSHANSSVLIECGGTKVVCALSVEKKVPQWMKNQKVPGGWLSCEYSMLPASTHERMKRESSATKVGGRTMEIQRLIGRSLRSGLDLSKLGENTIYIDCDVLDADGGTRCAGISGGALAMALGCLNENLFPEKPFSELIAAVSVGIIGGVPMLDLCYAEDSTAEVDMNVIMGESGNLVEVQGTAERAKFSRAQMNELLDLAEFGLKQIFKFQRKVIGEYYG